MTWHLDGAALFADVCSGCHGLNRPMSASIPTTDEAGALVHEMEENGVVVSDFETAAIVEYLYSIKNCAKGSWWSKGGERSPWRGNNRNASGDHRLRR